MTTTATMTPVEETIYGATLNPTSTTHPDGSCAEWTCGEFADTEIEDWNDYIGIGNLTELDADDFTIHHRPADARVFKLDDDNLFIAYSEAKDQL